MSQLSIDIMVKHKTNVLEKMHIYSMTCKIPFSQHGGLWRKPPLLRRALEEKEMMININVFAYSLYLLYKIFSGIYSKINCIQLALYIKFPRFSATGVPVPTFLQYSLFLLRLIFYLEEWRALRERFM